MRYIFTFLTFIAIVASVSCRKDFSTVPNFGALAFSKDTVFLDTIFTNIGSATYNLKVYNHSNKAITIPAIQLAKGMSSHYRLNVDGIAGKKFENIDILARDSMYVFIETTVDISTVSDPLYTDKILFDNGNKQQDVDLVTLVKDAHFIYPGKEPISMKIDSLTLDGNPTRIKGRFLKDEELIFTKEKAYVIYGYAAVPANKTLIIEAGAKIHFHANSGLIVDSKGSLKAKGTLEEKIVFEGDRLGHSFSNTPGQWGAIWMRAGSKENELFHTQIKNGIIGVLVDSIGSNIAPTLSLKNTEIYNNSNYGVLAREANVLGENVVIGSAGQSSLACTVGGTYNFTHSTIANYWSNSFRQLPALIVNNHFTYKDDKGNQIIGVRDLHAANFTNCIVQGNNNVEFVLDKVTGSLFNYNIENSLIQFDDVSGVYKNVIELDFTDRVHYSKVVLNGTPDFKNEGENNFIIGEKSTAINKAKNTTVLFDILGVSREDMPDIGAYQHIRFED
ncbi:Probable lipoprotein precursor [Tenacibaculum maritimum]|uniref:hypothetical protein n=1 Tax=Tenacibaculum maritimum TaxID=107401 RepID=UPI0012E4F80D|nr:hypothetical protein [Tenacibaculum maritimum]CAA0191659.1 Probable lipoprotein precursor [Tenacibaculum maritimum]CAA0256614.1 Probable lipoprotein precursor [Tenacibaculum maritimum]